MNMARQLALSAVLACLLPVLAQAGERELLVLQAGLDLFSERCRPFRYGAYASRHCPTTALASLRAELRPGRAFLLEAGLALGVDHVPDAEPMYRLLAPTPEKRPLTEGDARLELGAGFATPLRHGEVRARASVLLRGRWLSPESQEWLSGGGAVASVVSSMWLGLGLHFALDQEVPGIIRIGPRFDLRVGNEVNLRFDENLNEEYETEYRSLYSDTEVLLRPGVGLSLLTNTPVGFLLELGPALAMSLYGPKASSELELYAVKVLERQWGYTPVTWSLVPPLLKPGFWMVIGVEIRLDGPVLRKDANR